MSSVASVARALGAHPSVHQVGEDVAVVTDCLYPSNSAVTVYVSGGERECIVSDNGETTRVVKAHGIRVPHETRWLATFCKRYGLKEEHGKIYSPKVPLDNVGGAVVLVANAASAAARHAVEEYKYEDSEGVLDLIYAELVQMYGRPQVSRNVELAGASTRRYEFDFHVRLPRRKEIVADYVVPYAASINAKGAAHVDLGRLPEPPLRGLVYDEYSEWQSSELSFLQQAAQLIPYQKLRDGLAIFASH